MYYRLIRTQWPVSKSPHYRYTSIRVYAEWPAEPRIYSFKFFNVGFSSLCALHFVSMLMFFFSVFTNKKPHMSSFELKNWLTEPHRENVIFIEITWWLVSSQWIKTHTLTNTHTSSKQSERERAKVNNNTAQSIKKKRIKKMIDWTFSWIHFQTSEMMEFFQRIR